VPVDDLELAATVNASVAVPPGSGVTEVGRETVTPLGAVSIQARERPTTALNPLIDVTLSVVEPLDP